MNSDGYILIKQPSHPYSDCNGYIYEHRLVAGQMLGRLLLRTEIVHHQGTKYPMGTKEDRQDNRPENLMVVASIAEHKACHRHRQDTQKLGAPNPIILCACGCGLTLFKFDSSGRPRQYLHGHNRQGKLSWNPKELVTCGCGCGQEFPKFDKYGRSRKFISGHNMKFLSPNSHTNK